ncbi:MAG: ABC transporter permease, partial [Spirochaetota bacterium]
MSSTHSSLFTVATLVAHFFRLSFRRVSTWVIFVAVPIVGVSAMYLLVEGAELGILVFTSSLQACILALLSVREKELGVYKRILVAPVTGVVYAASLFLAVYLVLAFEIVVVVSAVYLIPVAQPAAGFGPVLAVLLAYGLAAAAYGVALTALVSTSVQGSIVANITVIFSSLIAGCFWPVTIMPETMQRLARILPQTWANLAIADLGSGAGLAGVAMELGLLGLYAVVFVLAYAV